MDKGELRIAPKSCKFCEDGIEVIDYKDIKLLQRYLSSYGRIDPHKKTGLCVRHQRKVSRAIKRARHIALLPYVSR